MSSSQGKMWTLEDDFRLLDMQHRGVELAVMAIRLERPVSTCSSRLQSFEAKHQRNSSQHKYAMSEFRNVNLCILCPVTRVKYLIQRNHPTIESIKEKTKASFSTRSSDFENMTEVKDSIVVISATERFQDPSCVEEAATLALPHLLDYSRGNPSIKILVGPNHRLQSPFLFFTQMITKARFVFTELGPEGSVIEMWGTLESVKDAFSFIMMRLRRHQFILSEEDLASGHHVD